MRRLGLRCCPVSRARLVRRLTASALLALMFLVVHHVRKRTASSKPSCIEAPARQQPIDESSGRPRVLLLWSTNASSFDLRARRCIESVLFHHPNATVRVYSNELPAGFFGEFRRAGYSVHVERFDVEALLRSTPAAPWLARLDEWRQGPYFYSHLTDALRLALLYREGGCAGLSSNLVSSRALTLRVRVC